MYSFCVVSNSPAEREGPLSSSMSPSIYQGMIEWRVKADEKDLPLDHTFLVIGYKDTVGMGALYLPVLQSSKSRNEGSRGT
jgi:hypothetical protein